MAAHLLSLRSLSTSFMQLHPPLTSKMLSRITSPASSRRPLNRRAGLAPVMYTRKGVPPPSTSPITDHRPLQKTTTLPLPTTIIQRPVPVIKRCSTTMTEIIEIEIMRAVDHYRPILMRLHRFAIQRPRRLARSD